MSKLLDVAMIVKNEAENLPSCLESLKALEPVLGGIYVYDTGSTDGTQDIARSYGATLQQGYWDDDFSRARNESVDMCESKWVLIVDADDRLRAQAAALKRELLGSPACIDAFSVSVSDHTGESSTNMDSIRILRRQTVRYAGVVHELPRVNGCDQPQSKAIDCSTLAISHTGYSADRREAKATRNLQLIDTAIFQYRDTRDQKALCRALIDRARTHAALGHIEDAFRDYAEAAAMPFEGKYYTWGLEKYADLLLNAGRTDEARTVIDRVNLQGGPPQKVLLLRARLALSGGDPEHALALVRQVDQLTDSADITHGTTEILRVRLSAAAQSGQHDEALACCLQLVIRHRDVMGLGRLLLILWNDRPANVLVQMLSEAPTDFIPQIAQEMADQDGIGPAVAQSLLSRVEPPMASPTTSAPLPA